MVENCDPLDLPAVGASFCAPVLNFGEAGKLHVLQPGNPIADFTDLAAITARLDNTTLSDDTKIRTFNIVGSKPKADSNAVEYSRKRKIYTAKDHTVPFKIDEVNDENYAFMEFLEANPGQSYMFLYEVNNYIYEVELATMIMDYVTPESDEELEYFDCLLEWTGDHPKRYANPFA